jgi:hypothetical protein
MVDSSGRVLLSPARFALARTEDAMSAHQTIPAPRLRTVANKTGLQLFQCDKMGPRRSFHDIVIVKATVTLSNDPVVAEKQAPILLADEPWEPALTELSSLKYAGDAVLTKLHTDVIVTGTARAPGGQPVPEWEAAVEVVRGSNTVLGSRAQVLGPRSWRHTDAKGWALTDPEPTLEVPIRYEMAYGGAYPADEPAAGAPEPDPDAPPPARWVVHPPNPSGTGFFDERAMDPAREYPAPQWQHKGHPVTMWNREVPLCGFGPVSRIWSSRLELAGTYDTAWVKKTRAEAKEGVPTDYAPDFDYRFFQCAHPELIAKGYLEGDERILLRGLLPDGEPRVAQLPRVGILATLIHGNGDSTAERLALDTVHVDVDKGTVDLCWRIAIAQDRDVRAATLTLVNVL